MLFWYYLLITVELSILEPAENNFRNEKFITVCIKSRFEAYDYDCKKYAQIIKLLKVKIKLLIFTKFHSRIFYCS